ncbi:MAG: protease inhibitor I42 family protein [Gemmatimonadetes bacterium]|nr:protease inhibitor I42 family protein [Gemmatimonadota bacterium]
MIRRLIPILAAIATLACKQQPAPQVPASATVQPLPQDTHPPANPAATVNNQLTVMAGDTFEITLRANLTTGYHWELVDSLDAKVVTLAGHEYVPYPNPQHAAGSGGTDHWTFRAVAAGRAEIALGNYPPGRREPAQLLRYTVTVR